MDKAKEMLKETNETISAICQEVGYSDTKYFVKCFQKYTGLKPNQYCPTVTRLSGRLLTIAKVQIKNAC